MATSNTRLPSLRKSVWDGDSANPRDVGEALRDLFTAVRGLLFSRIVEVNSVQWATPFAIANDHKPDAVRLVNARYAQQPTSLKCGDVAWDWFNNQIRVQAITTLYPGTTYDLVFMLIG
jgi:hypothetical protein